jgi:type I restriction enzyme S subunit
MPTAIVEKSKIKKVPKLRFPGFSDEWGKKKLGEVVEFWNGKAHEQDISKNGKYIVINSKFISQNGEVKKYSDSQSSPLKKDDIAIVMSDIPNGKAIGKCFLVDKDDAYTLNQRIGGIKSKEIKSAFLFRILNRNKYFLGFNNGVSQTNLRKDEVLGCPVIFPSHPEQKKITEFLNLADGWIENLRAQKAYFESYKKGMMQKIFSQEIRFKDDNGKSFSKWEEKKIGEIGKISGSSVDKKTVTGQKMVFLLNYMDVYKRGKIFPTDRFQEVSAKSSQIISCDLKKGDILFTPSSETPDDIGHSAVVMDDLKNVLFSYHLMRLRPKEKIFDLNFSAYIFNNFSFYKKLWLIAQGATRFVLPKEDFGRMKINLPSLTEQQKIAEFLASIDKIIESKKQQITQAEQWKKGLMQGLFM